MRQAFESGRLNDYYEGMHNILSYCKTEDEDMLKKIYTQVLMQSHRKFKNMNHSWSNSKVLTLAPITTTDSKNWTHTINLYSAWSWVSKSWKDTRTKTWRISNNPCNNTQNKTSNWTSIDSNTLLPGRPKSFKTATTVFALASKSYSTT